MFINPLRLPMIDDMTARHFTEKAQKDSIRCVKTFTAFLGRSPETADTGDLRRFRLHQAVKGIHATGSEPQFAI